MREEKFNCNNPDCDFIGFEESVCPECGGKLVKPSYDEYEDLSEGAETMNNLNLMSEDVYNDDPDAISWYDDAEMSV